MTELFAEENRLDAVNIGNEITDEEIFPYLGLALFEEDKRNKNLKKMMYVLCSTNIDEKNRLHTLEKQSKRITSAIHRKDRPFKF